MRKGLLSSGRHWVLAVLIFAAAAACENALNPFFEIDVNVANPGSGAGQVEAVEPNLDISCTLGPNSNCHETFNDAGGGGAFSLEATASEGSTFVQWLGCTSTNGNVCNLSFAASDTSFNVTAYFVGEGGPPDASRTGQ